MTWARNVRAEFVARAFELVKADTAYLRTVAASQQKDTAAMLYCEPVELVADARSADAEAQGTLIVSDTPEEAVRGLFEATE